MRFSLIRYHQLQQLEDMDIMGARNSRGFSEAVESGELVNESHIPYEGVFNQLKFNVGEKTAKIMDLHLGYARYQFPKSRYDPHINDYLAVFFKSERDGSDRDARPLNAVICLDVSGSMSGGLGGYHQKQSRSRLSLSVEAIKMFISKLRSNDSVGMVIFENNAKVIFKSTRKDELPTNVFDILDQLKAGGGTTIQKGFALSTNVLQEYLVSNGGDHNSENRIIMLTDVGDNSIKGTKHFIESASQQNGIHLTIVGISTEFRSEVCECLKNIKGFNYFCAVNQQDIKKYVFETFDFGFFPSVHDMILSISADDLSSFEVYGSTDTDKVAGYNDGFQGNLTNFVISKMPTIFPSEIEIEHGHVLTVGGLILLKLKRHSQQPLFKGQISLQYRTHSGTIIEEKYPFSYESPVAEQFFSEESLREAMEGYTFASEMRNLLRQAKIVPREKLAQEFLPVLAILCEITPKSKQKDLESVRNILDQSRAKVQAEL